MHRTSAFTLVELLVVITIIALLIALLLPVCLCLPPEKVQALGLPAMTTHNTSRHQTAFTVSVDAAVGITTGVSAAGRLQTVQAAVADDAGPDALSRPGHMFPLEARPGGVLERPGHTEATVDLVRLAGFKPYGVPCELMNTDGTMARGDEIRVFAQSHAMPWVTVADLIAYRETLDPREG